LKENQKGGGHGTISREVVFVWAKKMVKGGERSVRASELEELRNKENDLDAQRVESPVVAARVKGTP